MTRPEKLALLTKLVEAHDKLTAAQEPLHKLGVSPDSPCIEVPWLVLDGWCRDVSRQLEDLPPNHSWISWFIHENDCGREGFAAGPTGKTREIRTVEDLLWLIEL